MNRSAYAYAYAYAYAFTLIACGPKYDVPGPGAAPAHVEERSGPTPIAPPPPPAPPPADEEANDTPPDAGAEKPPPHASVKLDPSKGSKVSAQLQIVQLDDETRIIGTVNGLAKNGAYMLSKRDHCLGGKADDDSRRSSPVVYGISLKADANGYATVNDTAKAVHLDGPLAIVGAYFVVSKTAGSADLACGRVVAQ